MSMPSPRSHALGAFLLGACALLACGGELQPPAPSEGRADTLNAALSLPSEDTRFTGTMNATTRSWTTHTVNLSGSGRVEVSLDWDDPAANLHVYFYVDGQVVAYANKDNKPEVVSYEVPEGGDYVIGIKCASGSTDYALDVRFTPDVQVEQATGEISEASSWRTHDFELAAPGRVDVTLDWADPSADLHVYFYVDGEVVAYANKQNKPEAISYVIDRVGTYRIGIKCRTGATAYTLDVRLTPDATEPEPAPEVIELPFSGTTSPSNSWITHSFEAVAGETITATLDWADAAANLHVYLYDPTGVVVAYANKDNKPEVASTLAAVSGTWRVALKCASGSTDYSLLVTREVPDPTPPETADYPGKPAPGTVYWGAAVGGNSDPVARHEIPAGAPLSIRRTFFAWSHRTGSMINMARNDLAAGRLPWVSIKTPPWADMAAGLHDAEIDAMLRALDALDGPVWLTIHHEPDGGNGTPFPDDPAGPEGHLAMNRRVRERMTALGTDNIALANILIEWTWNPLSGRNPDEWWEDGIYDFLGVDQYRNAEATLINETWLKIRRWAADRNVDVAVGEWGLRGDSQQAGAFVREWYQGAVDSHADGLGARVVGLSAFDSGLNSPNGSWELRGGQLEAFQELLSDPRTASVNDHR